MTDKVSAILAKLDTLDEEMLKLRRELVTNLGRTDPGSSEISVLECRASGHRFGLLLNSIDVVVPVVQLLPLQEAPPWVVGSLNYHGTNIVVLDVAHRLAGVTHVISSSELIIICSAGWRQMGLLVDEVLDIIDVHATEVHDPAPGLRIAPFLAGVLHQHAGSLPLIEVSRFATGSLSTEAEA